MSNFTSEGLLDTYRKLSKTGYREQQIYTWIHGYRTGYAVSHESIASKSKPRWGDEERIDVQSGATPRWQITFREADQAIRNAYDALVPREAMRVISAIWEQLDRTSELAAARNRLLVGKLGKPRLAPLPKWFEDQKAKLLAAEEGEVAANPFAVVSAEFLVRAALAAIPQGDELEAELETGPMGRVVIDWFVPKGRLQWMVDAIDIQWPSVKVYQVSHQAKPESPMTVDSRIFYNAFDLVDSFVKFLGSN